MSRVARRRAVTRERLIAAARRVFAEKGFYAATIGDLTEAADVGFGTFYLYFPSKEAIFASMAEEGFQDLLEAVDAAQQGEDRNFYERQRAAIRAYVEFAYANRDLFRAMYHAGGMALDIVLKLQRPFEERIVASLRLGIDHGLLRPLNAELMAPVIVAALRRAGLWWRDHDQPGPEQVAEELADFVLNGLRRSHS